MWVLLLLSVLILSVVYSQKAETSKIHCKINQFDSLGTIIDCEINDITVLNKQEHPRIYGNWTVNFTTKGKSDLIIKTDDKTNYEEDIEIVQLKCEEDILFNKDMSISDVNIRFTQDEVVIHNYSCQGTSSWTVRLLKCEKHRQYFIFGDDEDFADNACEGTDTYTLRIYDPLGNVVQSCSEQTINPTGGEDCDNTDEDSCSLYVTCQRVGEYNATVDCYDCTSHSSVNNVSIFNCTAPTINQFLIRNFSRENIASIDEKGFMYLRGENYSNMASLNPPPFSFVKMNSSHEVVAYINLTGDLHLKGKFEENQDDLSPPPYSFIVRNSTGDYVAYIDQEGNLNMTGYIYERWIDDI